tara:strand:+ start:2694 stop:2927 length:234 start_codon:yes stop_codon:yes gene_type:complete
MFTIEMDWDETALTILDSTGSHEDVQFLIYDDVAYIRQWDQDGGGYSLIEMSPEQFNEMNAAMHLPEGAYLMGSNDD